MTAPNPDASQQPAAQPAGTSGQTDYQEAYNRLLGRIQAGEFVEQKVYAGLQQKYQEQFDAQKRTQQALDATNAEISNLQGQLTGLSATVSSAQAEKGTLAGENANLKQRISRFELIGKQYPNLITWEAQGLLPSTSLEDLPAVLEQINAQLESKGSQVKQQVVAGANALNTGSDANTAVAVTAAVKLQEYNSLVLRPNGKSQKEIQAVWEEYLALKAKEK